MKGKEQNPAYERGRSKQGKGFFKNIVAAIKDSGEGFRGRGGLRMAVDIGIIFAGFLFGGCHIVFGAYPLGLCFLAALPSSVWFALLGAVVGSFTIGDGGIIYALIMLLVVFLRVVISGGGVKRIFHESILLRVAAGVIGGFILGVYEILLNGFSLTTIAFALSITVFPVVLVSVFCFAFDTSPSPEHLIFGKEAIFPDEQLNEKRRFDLMLFRVSALVFIFLISLSLSKYKLFGVDFSLIFASIITLFSAKRFGAVYGIAVGFASSVCVSPLYSSAFALLGLASGGIFPFGNLYAVIAGGISLSLFGVYAGGVNGLLTVLPEGLIGLTVMYPMFKHLECERKKPKSEDTKRQAIDMVGTMALSYRCKMRMYQDEIEVALTKLSALVNDTYPGGVYGYNLLSPTEGGLIIPKLMREARERSEQTREINEELTEALEEVVVGAGFKNGVIRAFGKQNSYIILATEDRDGTLITSPEFKRALEIASGTALSTPRFYRRDNMALMETEQKEGFSVNIATHSQRGGEKEISGDTAISFSSENGEFYSLISDGMGSGDRAKSTSGFAAEFFNIMKNTGAEISTLVYMINDIIRAGEECAATLDMFIFDKINGKGRFFKAGAAPAYIKRGDALFRIKSESMPIGVMKKVDVEMISADVLAGDFVIMMSDGIAGADEDAPWLIEYLRGDVKNIQSYAEGLIKLASDKNLKIDTHLDDMTVSVIEIK